MNGIRRVLPHPVTSAALLFVWLLLQQTIAPGHIVLGTFLGIAIPRFTKRFWPEHVRISRPTVIVRFISVVLFDILAANFSVARLALGAVSEIKPGFVRLPVDLQSDFALTVLASTVSLTPGTVSAEISADRGHLIIHYLASDNEDELIRSVKLRYEEPLKEIFQC